MKSNPTKWVTISSLPLSLLLGSSVEAAAAQAPFLALNAEIQQASLTKTLLQSQDLKPSNLLQEGKEYYQSRQFSAAIKAWEDALKIYSDRGDNLHQIQVLNYLSLAYQELGEWQSAKTAIATSLDRIPDSRGADVTALLLQAQALNIQGKLLFSQGQTEKALQIWQHATSTYERAGDETGALIGLLNQAQALQSAGKYRQTTLLLEKLVAELQQKPDDSIKAQGLIGLGIALQGTGNLIRSKTILEESLSISQKLNSTQDISVAYFAIGNVAKDLGQYDVAQIYYQEAARLSLDKTFQLQALLNQLSLLLELQRWQPAAALLPEIKSTLAEIPPSRTSIYARVNLAESLMTGIPATPQVQSSAPLTTSTSEIALLLGIAVQQAQQIDDPRAEAYTLNQLGRLYRQQGQVQDAQGFFNEALQLAQAINADDIIARAATQLGSLRKEKGDIQGAIAAYDLAFIKLQSLRSDLVTINPDIQFSFKENIEPTYRDYVSVLLSSNANQSHLQKARQVMEALQVAELDNFFRDACLDTHPVVIDEIDERAAVIYPIILQDRLEVILSIPQQPLRHYSTPLNAAQIDVTLKKYYSSLSPGYPRDEGLRVAEEIYRWLIKPAEDELKTSATNTLVFVPDGFFRSLPMSALFDGEKYLIETYGIAFSPGLQLFPESLRGKQPFLLVAGLTEARQGFTPLPGVEGEVEQIKTQLDSQVLLDQDFSRDSFNVALNQKAFSIVHLATHGQFSSNPEDTFLLTWGDRISIQDLDTLFQSRKLGIIEPIELLVMSACQTAVGDDRATLGLAGFALRSGARSTVASLWSVSDEATSDLMREFYVQLSDEAVSKAEALQQAQISVLSNPLYKHPYFWSAFTLIGNWL